MTQMVIKTGCLSALENDEMKKKIVEFHNKGSKL